MIDHIDTFPGREIIVDNKKYLYFGGTSYLGLQTHEAFQEIFIKNVRQYGTNYGASRESNVRISVYKKGENYLTKLVGSEDCVTISSGYLAGQFLVQHFNTPNYELCYTPNTHSALYVNNPKATLFTSYSDLNTKLHTFYTKKPEVTPIVLLDAIDFIGINYPDFEKLRSLPLDKIILIVDDSHGIGIVGPNGNGVFNQLKKINAKELIVCCSLGKGFGIQAGAIFGNSVRIAQLRNTDFYGGASPSAPAYMATLIESDHIYKNRREQLKKNIAFFRTELKYSNRFLYIKGYPTFSSTDCHLISYLRDHGIIITNFHYPSDKGDVMSRIVISAYHKKNDLLKLSMLINRYYDKI